MRSKWYGLGCLTSIVLVIIVVILVFHGASNYFTKYTGEKKKVADNTWLILTLDKEVKEFTEISEDFWGSESKSAHNYIQAIDRAATDSKITGIILCPQYFTAGYATLNQLMDSLNNFKASGKPVYAYLNSVTNRGYYIASVADQIYLNPSSSAGILLTGIGGHILYYEQLLEKLGIEMQVIHAGKYKAAGEQFVRNEMSPEFRENLTSLYSDMYQEMLSTIARNRGIETKDLANIYEERDNIWINGQNSLKTGLVDELTQYQELLDRNNIKKTNQLVINDYPLPPLMQPDSKIAVLYAEGNITAQAEPAIDVITSAKLIRQLDELESNPKIKGIVLRINSPGGSALESDIILSKLLKVQRSKPLVVSMGSVAASGGYYIACGADYIYADPMTITGSIGVVSIFPNLNKMGDKIGVNSSSIKYGKYSDILNPWDRPSSSELAAMEASMMEIYDEFKSHVASGRNMTLNQVESIAQGRVWSSLQAKNNGLIDEVGNLGEAVKKAAEIAGVSKYATVYYPEQKSLMDYFLKEYFNIEMATQVLAGKIDYLDIIKELNFLQALRTDPRQTYCPVTVD
ncbi:MAG: signal peptide peptidase SppA [Candidatus Cloacimonetes bacterium]|nr:signal peptide peptidase SppA [Candidatus Cloacimonadota bacterium]